MAEVIQQHHLPVSFFEITTMMGFLHFKNTSCDYAVVEVGLGGLIDATNIVSSFLTCITSIGFDHMEVLGDSIE